MEFGNELVFFVHIMSIVLISWCAAYAGRCALVSWIVLQGVLANLLVLKQAILFGLQVTCSDVYIVGSILSLNLLQEQYGKQQARRAIYIGFSLMLTYLLMSQFQLWYVPSALDVAQSAYTALFAVMPRLVIASVITYLLVQLFDTQLYAWLRMLMRDRFFVMRSACSLIVSQVLDTALFTVLGLYGMVAHPLHIFVMSLAVKLVVISCMVPLMAALRLRK